MGWARSALGQDHGQKTQGEQKPSRITKENGLVERSKNKRLKARTAQSRGTEESRYKNKKRHILGGISKQQLEEAGCQRRGRIGQKERRNRTRAGKIATRRDATKRREKPKQREKRQMTKRESAGGEKNGHHAKSP